MKDGPSVAALAALLGDPARANMLTALMDGRALTVSEHAGAALTVQGTDLDLAAMSGSIEGMTPDRLHHASEWFLRESTLKAANQSVVDHRLPFSATWGDGKLVRPEVT